MIPGLGEQWGRYNLPNGKVHRTAELVSAQLMLLMKGISVPSVSKVTQLLHKGSTVLHDMENCTLNILICTYIYTYIIYTYIHTYITLHDMTWHDVTWHYITYIHTYIYLVCVLMMHVFLCPLNSMCVYIYIHTAQHWESIWVLPLEAGTHRLCPGEFQECRKCSLYQSCGLWNVNPSYILGGSSQLVSGL